MLCLNLVGCKILITLICIIFTKYKSLLYPCTILTYLLNGILNKREIEDSSSKYSKLELNDSFNVCKSTYVYRLIGWVAVAVAVVGSGSGSGSGSGGGGGGGGGGGSGAGSSGG
jgi:hypothetical protein